MTTVQKGNIKTKKIKQLAKFAGMDQEQELTMEQRTAQNAKLENTMMKPCKYFAKTVVRDYIQEKSPGQ